MMTQTNTKRGIAVTVNGKEREAVEAYSSGPGAPVHTYVLRGGDRVERSGDEWRLTVKGAAFWEPKPLVDVVRVATR